MKKILSLLLLVSLFSCGPKPSRQHRKEYKKIRKMEKKKESNSRRASREVNYSEVDTIYYNWRPITDTLLLGTPKIKK
jgi:hypothetical protein